MLVTILFKYLTTFKGVNSLLLFGCCCFGVLVRLPRWEVSCEIIPFKLLRLRYQVMEKMCVCVSVCLCVCVSVCPLARLYRVRVTLDYLSR